MGSPCIPSLKTLFVIQLFLLKLTWGDDCDDPDLSKCLTCAQGVVCSTGLPRFVECNLCGMVCKPDSKGLEDPSCSAFYDRDYSTNAVCFCRDSSDDTFLSNGDYPDPYDEVHTAYVTCSDGNPRYHTCPSGELYFGTLGCIEIRCESSTDLVEIPGLCNFYFDCSLDAPVKCGIGQIFYQYHPSNGIPGCYHPEDVCGAMVSPSQYFQDPNVCYLGHMCSDPTQLVETMCCPYGTSFDNTTLTCNSSEPCPQVGYCTEYYWEKEECNPCESEIIGHTYASRKPCSSYYYECVEEEGRRTPELRKCEYADDVYDPDRGYCYDEYYVNGC